MNNKPNNKPLITNAPPSTPVVPRSVDTTEEIHQFAVVAAKAADDKKADEVLVLDVGDTLGITDAFVIASAPNSRLVAFLADTIEAQVKAAGGPGPLAVEGLDECSWVLMDFGGFVVHIFLEETRRYYDLERLWADAPRIDWNAEAA
jgi:ribosome-associated protein